MTNIKRELILGETSQVSLIDMETDLVVFKGEIATTDIFMERLDKNNYQFKYSSPPFGEKILLKTDIFIPDFINGTVTTDYGTADMIDISEVEELV